MTLTLFVIAGVLAVADWVAVERRYFHLEYVFKPATLAVLLAAAVVADLGVAQPWIVAGLALGLVGDVALTFADEERADLPFMAGLGAFLLGHVAYVVGFVRAGLHGLPVLAGALVLIGVAGLNLPAVLRGARERGGRPLVTAVAGYSAVLGAMMVLAAGTQHVATALGGLAFLVSDMALARDRFVARIPHGHLLVHVTYHLAQFLIVLGLLQ